MIKRERLSPFYSRNYGGLSDAQIAFAQPHLSKLHGPILDPMAGQGHYLSHLAASGREIYIGDINPGPLLLATLRDPRALRDFKSLIKWFTARLDRVRPIQIQTKPTYCERWIPAGIQGQLNEYKRVFQLEKLGDPLTAQSFWQGSVKQSFAAAIPVLVARQIACYTCSDNLTWLKMGGLQSQFDIVPAITAALDEWRRYAESLAHTFISGRLQVERMNAEKGFFGSSPRPNIIITSPPYANRLDYTRLWAPELEVLAAMFSFDSALIKRSQIGTTSVKGVKVTHQDRSKLPAEVLHALETIRHDTLNKASLSYYYPFFLNYALAMTKTFRALGKDLDRRGRIVVFVRDTVRKDVIFPAGDLVVSVLKSAGVGSLIERKETIIRTHVGLRRRDAQVSMHGLAQREWSIVMEKG
jgi:hypothetical protein